MSNYEPEDEKEELKESEDVLKDMIKNLDELPTDVLKQLLHNHDEIEKYNKEHPEEIYDDNNKK